MAPPPTEPFKLTQLVPQLVWPLPASAVGGVATVRTAGGVGVVTGGLEVLLTITWY